MTTSKTVALFCLAALVFLTSISDVLGRESARLQASDGDKNAVSASGAMAAPERTAHPQDANAARTKLERIRKRIGQVPLLDRVHATASKTGDRVFRQTGWSIDDQEISDEELIELLSLEAKEFGDSGREKERRRNEDKIREIGKRIERREQRDAVGDRQSANPEESSIGAENEKPATSTKEGRVARPVVIEMGKDRLEAESIELRAGTIELRAGTTAAKEQAEQQILLDCEILEVDESQIKPFGVDLATLINGSRSLRARRVDAGLMNGSHVFKHREWQALTHWLKSNDIAEVISRPSVMTLSGRNACVQMAQQVPLLLVEEDDETQRARVEFREIGTQMDVTPVLLNGDSMRLEIVVEHSEIDDADKDDRRRIQGLSTRKVNTQVEAQANQTIVLFGLFSPDPGEAEDESTHLLIAVTPRIVDADGDAHHPASDPVVQAAAVAIPRPRQSPHRVEHLARAAEALRQAGEDDLAREVFERAQQTRDQTGRQGQRRKQEGTRRHSGPSVLQQILREARQMREDVGQLRRDVNGLRGLLETGAGHAARLGGQQLEDSAKKPKFEELVAQYDKLMKQKRYREAEMAAKQAERLAPDNPVTHMMLWKALFAGRNVEAQFDKVLRVFRGQSHFIDAERTVHRIALADPAVADVMQFTPEQVAVIGRKVGLTSLSFWFEKEAKPSIHLVHVLPEPERGYVQPVSDFRTDEEKEIAERLQKKISVELIHEPLDKALREIFREADINIVLDESGLEEEGITSKTPVSIVLNGVRADSALKLILEPMHLVHVIDDEVLKITSARRAGGPRTVETYPVGDLVESQSSDGETPLSLNALSKLIVSTVQPNSWSEVGGWGVIQAYEVNSTLVIRNTKDVHEQILRLLELLRDIRVERRANNDD